MESQFSFFLILLSSRTGRHFGLKMFLKSNVISKLPFVKSWNYTKHHHFLKLSGTFGRICVNGTSQYYREQYWNTIGLHLILYLFAIESKLFVIRKFSMLSF